MMKKFLFFAVAAMAAFSSCTNEFDPVAAVEGQAFTATIESSSVSRTYLAPGSDADHKKVCWSNGDAISVNGVSYYAQVNAADASKATFVANGAAARKNAQNKFVGVYPASIASPAGGYALPSVINYEANSFANMPMYAETATDNFTFRNITSVLAITVKSTDIATLKSIKVSSANEALSGDFTVMEDANGPWAELSEGAKASKQPLVLTLATAATLTTAGTTYYIPIPIQTYHELKVELSSDGSTYTEAKTTRLGYEVVVERNRIYELVFDGGDPAPLEIPIGGPGIFDARQN